ncbi:hypothetical protein [Kolteria novifilia]|uniref:hypothetical protein n=1 Tax=Kolteria novifilia TaxID=2527975 RepID=UPI003AF36F59
MAKLDERPIIAAELMPRPSPVHDVRARAEDEHAEERERRILYYQARAERGEPLFEGLSVATWADAEEGSIERSRFGRTGQSGNNRRARDE